jgi:chitodextrinase
VAVSISFSGKSVGVNNVTYYLNGAYLILAYQSPYSFILPTEKWQDGSYTLSVAVLLKDGYAIANQPSISVTFSNGNAQPPVNGGTFTPSFTNPAPGSPFIVAAAGDGADGTPNDANVTNEVLSMNPNVFLYLGDVYYSGSVAEFYNWYGAGSTFYSRFRAITDPTVGNHEYLTANASGYYDYWNNIPTYYSFNAGGWHFISINSNGSKVGGVAKGSAEYNWLANDLAANSNLCTIAYYHHPLYNIGPEGPDTAMSSIWALMAQNGVSLVLNGHDHDYQRWVPLDGSGNPSPTGVTEIIAGTGGHGIQKISKSDPRVAFSEDVSPTGYGVLKLTLASTGATFSYINTSGTTLDSGFIACNKAGGDTQPPTVPAGLNATAVSSTQVNLAWQASTDNVGVAGYTIYRDGTSLNTVSGTTLAYTDNTAQPSTSYSYTVDAFDAAGNHSAQSTAASVTTPSGSDTQAPSIPTGLIASAASATQVNLAWQASTDNVGVTGYTIFRNGTSLNTVSGTTLAYTDNTVQPSTSYFYTVDAFDAAGNHSAQSTAASVTTPSGSDTQAPSIPTGLTAIAASATQVNLAWQASMDNVGVAGYTIYRDEMALNTVSGTTLAFTDNTAQPSTSYAYTVDAFDAAGNYSAQSAAANVTTPSMPSSLTFPVGADTYVNSNSPSSNYGSLIKWYTDGSPVVHGYLQFTVSGLNGVVPLHAYLHVYANSSSNAGIYTYSVPDNSWGEKTITYNNAPAFGALLGASGSFGSGTWLTIDVSSFITAEGTYSFGISTPGSTNISFAAKESGINGAYLVVSLP